VRISSSRSCGFHTPNETGRKEKRREGTEVKTGKRREERGREGTEAKRGKRKREVRK
jgi:hypothetical protein